MYNVCMKTLYERFQDKYIVDPETNCWLWQGQKHSQGYGQLWIEGRRKKILKAHRVAANLFLGMALDSPLKVCHRCDHPSCVNPEHLWLGTQAENNRDRMAKGRNANQDGENGWSWKLTSQQVSEIKELYRQGSISQTALAERYGVKQPQISRIILGTSRRRA